MTPHDTYLELAAIAIDFPLAPSERGRLEQHLAGCPACARRASAFRGDALALGHLPAVILPERRGAEILAAALHSGAVRHPLRLLVLAALLGLLLVGSLAVGAQLLRNPEDELSVVVLPVPTATPGPEASGSPAPSASAGPHASPVVPASALAWEELGTLNQAGVKGLVAFDGGYVAYGTTDALGPVAWFSADGRTWEATPLAGKHLNCPTWGPPGDEFVPDAEVTTGATNGRQVLLAGAEQLFTDAACSNAGSSVRMVAWVSSDGRTWQRSDGFAPGTTNARVAGAWPVGDGWHVTDEFSGQADPSSAEVWASPDGLAWERAAVALRHTTAAVAPLAIGPDGALIVNERGQQGGPFFGLAAWVGGVWRDVTPPEQCAGEPSIVLPPLAAGSGSWLIAAEQGLCSSADLAGMVGLPPPRGDVGHDLGAGPDAVRDPGLGLRGLWHLRPASSLGQRPEYGRADVGRAWISCPGLPPGRRPGRRDRARCRRDRLAARRRPARGDARAERPRIV